MAYEETSVAGGQEVPEGSEAPEAEGVAATDLGPVELLSDESSASDSQTLDELDDQERAELEEWAAQFEAEAGPEARGISSVRLSKNFVLAEFHCCRSHCVAEHVPAKAVPALRWLVAGVLQPMRDQFGRCTVYSGYRNAQHNRHVGGVANSCHRYDVRPQSPAADVAFARGGVEEWAAEARRRLHNIGGVGKYPAQRFVHVDLGPRRSW